MRLVSLVPSQTELLADLGLDAEVVGVTRFCVHPADWKRRKRLVGGTKHVRVEVVRSLQPTLVLANKEENVREQVEALAAFAPVHVTDIPTVAAALAMIRTVGALVDRAAAAEALADDLAAALAALPPAPTAIRTAYLIWRDPWMTVGGDTFISDLLRLGGFHNVFADRTRYPVVTPADLAAAQPDVVLLSSEPYPFGAAHQAELAAQLPDVPSRLVDGEVLSWYGSRLRHAAPYLRRLRGLC